MTYEVGAIVEGKVTGIAKFGAFVALDEKTTGMVHISEVSSTFVQNVGDILSEGQTVKVKILSIGEDGKIALSIKKAAAPAKRAPKPTTHTADNPGSFEWQPRKTDCSNFEEMMKQFMQDSDEKLSDLKRVTDEKHGSRRK